MRKSIVLSLIVMMTLLSTGSAMGAIVNGFFENPIPAPWGRGGGGPAPCDLPRIVPGALDPFAEGGVRLAWIGDWLLNPADPGCNPSFIYQFFECDTGGQFCVVEFDAFFVPRGPGEIAFVYLRLANGGTGVWIIPPWRRLNDVTVAVPCNNPPECGPAFVAFAVYDPAGPGAGVQSVLLVDNVESRCNDTGQARTTLEPCTECDTSFLDDVPDPPTDEPPIDTDDLAGACCGGEGCMSVPETICEEGIGKYRGDDSLCEVECPDPIPTVSQWGMAVLVLLILTAATVVIVRRRAMVT
jgi:hypothetical protein